MENRSLIAYALTLLVVLAVGGVALYVTRFRRAGRRAHKRATLARERRKNERILSERGE